jgi:hypothetical protein
MRVAGTLVAVAMLAACSGAPIPWCQGADCTPAVDESLVTPSTGATVVLTQPATLSVDHAIAPAGMDPSKGLDYQGFQYYWYVGPAGGGPVGTTPWLFGFDYPSVTVDPCTQVLVQDYGFRKTTTHRVQVIVTDGEVSVGAGGAQVIDGNHVTFTWTVDDEESCP